MLFYAAQKLKFIVFNFKLSDSLALTVSKYEWKWEHRYHTKETTRDRKTQVLMEANLKYKIPECKLHYQSFRC